MKISVKLQQFAKNNELELILIIVELAAAAIYWWFYYQVISFVALPKEMRCQCDPSLLHKNPYILPAILTTIIMVFLFVSQHHFIKRKGNKIKNKKQERF